MSNPGQWVRMSKSMCHIKAKGRSVKSFSAVAVIIPVLAGCVKEDEFVTGADISEANRNTDCPVDVTEADRANFPACN